MRNHGHQRCSLLHTWRRKTNQKLWLSLQVIVSRGGRFLEAPVSGNQQLSNDGMLVILAAGDRGLYEDCSSCFQAMGKTSFFLGNTPTHLPGHVGPEGLWVGQLHWRQCLFHMAFSPGFLKEGLFFQAQLVPGRKKNHFCLGQMKGFQGSWVKAGGDDPPIEFLGCDFCPEQVKLAMQPR